MPHSLGDDATQLWLDVYLEYVQFWQSESVDELNIAIRDAIKRRWVLPLNGTADDFDVQEHAIDSFWWTSAYYNLSTPNQHFAFLNRRRSVTEKFSQFGVFEERTLLPLQDRKLWC